MGSIEEAKEAMQMFNSSVSSHHLIKDDSASECF